MQIFPTFRGLTFPTTKTISWLTQIQAMVSGKETRSCHASLPTIRWQLDFEFLSRSDYEHILNFYHDMRGAKSPFLFYDPADAVVEAQLIGRGDGERTEFQLFRDMDGLYYPATQIKDMASATVDGNEAPYILLDDGVLCFATAPDKGQAVEASFTYYYKVRFSAEDEADYEQFARDLWSLKSLTLVNAK